MNQELKEIITGFIFFAIVIFFAWLLFGSHPALDLNSNYQERQGQYDDDSDYRFNPMGR